MNDKKMPIALYVYIFPKMQEVAKKFGYALAIHGSCARDFDLVAIPWVKEAASMEVILEALRVACDGFPTRTDEKDSTKPHGRKSFSIVLGSDMFVDLSIMPLQPDPRPEGLTVEEIEKIIWNFHEYFASTRLDWCKQNIKEIAQALASDPSAWMKRKESDGVK